MSFPIVVIGASAGSLEPLERFFDQLSKAPSFSVLVMQHLSPNHESMMDELLAKHTRLPISVVEEDTKIKVGQIYLNHASKHIYVDKEYMLKVSAHDRKKLSYPINFTMESVAKNFESDSSAVILSGTGSDESEGIKAIQEKGGLTIVQSPGEAKFAGMPNSALRTKCVDLELYVDDMPLHISRFFSSAARNNEEIAFQKNM